MTVEEIVQHFNMQAHPEGGYYVETYRSTEKALNGKSVATIIYFLMPSGKVSTWHRIKSDEAWFYHAGSAMTVYSIENNKCKKVVVGPNILSGEQPQYIVPAGAIFGSCVEAEHSYSLVSCVVAPGFEFEDFELFSREEMLEFFPHLELEIDRLIID